MREAFEQFYSKDSIVEMSGDEYLDGGDVMRVGNTYYIGLSSRTNQAGANRLIQILKDNEGMDGVAVKLPVWLHLKTIVTCLDHNLLVGIKEI